VSGSPNMLQSFVPSLSSVLVAVADVQVTDVSITKVAVRVVPVAVVAVAVVAVVNVAVAVVSVADVSLQTRSLVNVGGMAVYKGHVFTLSQIRLLVWVGREVS